jgi:hypothetical protein
MGMDFHSEVSLMTRILLCQRERGAALGAGDAMIKPFPWRPGMLTTTGLRIDAVDEQGRPYRLERDRAEYAERGAMIEVYARPDSHPDTQDGATLGAFRQVIRDLRGDPSWSPTPLEHDPGVVEWVIDPPSRERQTLYPSEFAAMMAAYERITWPTS